MPKALGHGEEVLGLIARPNLLDPTATANPLGATYVHMLTSEDGVINATLKGSPPLRVINWAGQVGAIELLPTSEPGGEGLTP
jgi:hypothetical protein